MTTMTRGEPDVDKSPPGPVSTKPGFKLGRGWLLLGVCALWVVFAVILHGKDTKAIGGAEQNGVADWFADRANDIVLADEDNFFIGITHGISSALDSVINWFQFLISSPAFPSPYPHIGFLGVLAIAWYVTALIAGWRMSLLVAACFASFALLGFYEDSMDLLIVTLVAVFISAVIGLPIAVWMAHSSRARAIVTPILDVMQTLPSFTYLMPLMLLFGINAAAAVICTLIYSLPPVMRIAAHGLQNLPAYDTRGDRLDGPDQVATAAEGRAADGQADDHRRPEPDNDGGAVDGHHRRLHQRPRPRPAGGAGPERAASR